MTVLMAAAVLLELTTSGGISGKGNGRTTISSDYSAVYETVDGQKCRRKLTADEATRLRTVIAHSRPDTWRAKTVAPHPDELVFTLRHRGGRKPRLARWTDHLVDSLPLPLSILIHELDELRSSALEACGLLPPDSSHSGKHE